MENNKPNNIKDLSLLDKIPKEKNLYPKLEISKENSTCKKLPIIKQEKEYLCPKPSAPPAPLTQYSEEPKLFKESFETFLNLENRHYSSSSDDSLGFDC